MNMQITPCSSMFNTDQIAVFNEINRISCIPSRRTLIVSFDKPSIIWISDIDSSDLLFSSSDRIELSM